METLRIVWQFCQLHVIRNKDTNTENATLAAGWRPCVCPSLVLTQTPPLGQF